MLVVYGLRLALAAAVANAGHISEASLAHFVEEYAALGPSHLTGSHTDAATSQWIFDELRGGGLEVQYQSYTLPGPRVWMPKDEGASSNYGCHLLVDSTEVPCYVVHQPPLHPQPLHDVPMERILVVSFVEAIYIFKAEDIYRSFLRPDGTLPYDAVILINGQTGNITEPQPVNWDHAQVAPSIVPVVTVGWGFQSLLHNARRLTSLILFGQHRAQESRNVLAQLFPQNSECQTFGPEPIPLYIGTPINGFFHAAGERGAGIALLLAIAKEWAMDPPCNGSCLQFAPIFAFTSGHEQRDPGISNGAIPFLRQLASSQNRSLNEVPFISIGAHLGGFANFKGQNFDGPGTGIDPVVIRTSSGSGRSSAMLDKVLLKLAHLAFVQLEAGEMNVSNQVGAVQQALLAGMPAMNLVGQNLSHRFHLPSDADSTSINFTTLLALTQGMSQALQTTVCRPAAFFGAMSGHALIFPFLNPFVTLLALGFHS